MAAVVAEVDRLDPTGGKWEPWEPQHPYAGTGPRPWVKWKTADRAKRLRMWVEKHVIIPDGFGAGGPAKLYPEQREVLAGLLSTRLAVWCVAKGNTKSSTAAMLALWVIADPYPGDLLPMVAVVSGSKEQARAVFDTAADIVRSSPALQRVFVIYGGNERPRITCPQTGGEIRLYGSRWARIHSIKPSCAILDEIGLIGDQRIWRSLVQSLGKRPGSMVFGIGTPGPERGELYRLIAERLAGESDPADGLLSVHHWGIDEGGDPADPKQWAKANPIRRRMNPAGWVEDLRRIRATLKDPDEWLMFHCAQWPELNQGRRLVPSDEWERLDLDPPVEAPWWRIAVVEGNANRRNVAVIVGEVWDGHVHLSAPMVWEHQTGEVDPAAIAEAVTSTGPISKVWLRTGGQLREVETLLKAEGITCERVHTHSATVMREPTDAFLEAVAAGTVTHNGADRLTAHIKATRVEKRREGETLARDERLAAEGVRSDAALAAVVAVHRGLSYSVPAIR